jgi:hypothetical protein
MSKPLRWLSWTPSSSPFPKAAPPSTDKLTQPHSVSSVSSPLDPSQEMGPEEGNSVSSVSSPCHTSQEMGPESQLPWPTYNNGRQFRCELCGAHFDTSCGIAKHQVHGCETPDPPAQEPARTMPSCPACGSYCLYREKDGSSACETCMTRF